MEENHTIGDLSGLESLGNSEAVTNISEFLKLEDLDFDKGTPQDDFMPGLDQVNKIPAAAPSITAPVAPTTPTGTVAPTTGEPLTENPLQVRTVEDTSIGDLSTLDIEEDKTIPVTPLIGGNYKAVLSELISEGILDGIESFTDEDGNETPFEEMEIDKETLIALIKQNQEDIKEELKKDSIDSNGVSDFTKKLISIEKHGGNVQQALATYQQVKHPIDTIDINDVAGQKAMCYLRFQAQGIDDSMSKDLISAYEAKGILEEKAIESKEQLDIAFQQSIAKQEELAIEQEKEYKAALKTYRATLDNVFKDQQLSDTHRRKLLDIATKQNDKGDFELDVLIENFRRNPIDAADLIMFVTNKEDFIKKKSEAMVKEERKNTLKKVSFIKKNTASGLTVPEKAVHNDPYLLDLSKL